MMIRTLASTAIFGLIASSASAQSPVALQEQPATVLKAPQKFQPYELPAGTVFDLVIEHPNELLPVAMVSSNVYDYYGNVSVPRGSRLIGRFSGAKNGRQFVEWTELQLSNLGGTLRIDPPLIGTMRDGTAGYDKVVAGAAVMAVNQRGFIIPH
ncbi:MAG: conjugal transfer protein [Glaciimonas sp.]|nr:conjugal transfer protein [Glaciimonas sp.]